MHTACIKKFFGTTTLPVFDYTIEQLTRRIDRTPTGEKIAMEDMCQLTERQTEHKYKSSYERIGNTVLKYSSLPKMDVTNFFELVLFSWLTGNNDMHLKNFSLYEVADKIRLTPAYDLLNAAIINPKDDEELALTLNGRKKKLQREDFIKSAATLGVENVIVERLINKYIKLLPKFEAVIQNSFLSVELKEKYGDLLRERRGRLSQETTKQ